MSKTRINTETGIIENQSDDWGDRLLDIWEPDKDADGSVTRVNTETGVVEEQSDSWGDRLLDIWTPKK